ncbi:hypothetical protein [Deinococcus sp. UYEF24]
MNILTSLHPDIEVLPDNTYSSIGAPFAAPVSSDDEQQLLQRFPEAPLEYLELINIYDGMTFIEKDPDDTKHGVLVMSIFSALDALYTMTEWHPFLITQMPGCFFFARDSGDGYLFGSKDGQYGVYRVSLAYAEWEGATYLGESLRAVLIEGKGLASS